MPSESPTCVRTGGDSADARIEYISPGRSFQPTKSFIGIENLGLKSTNLAKPLLCLRSCLRSSRAFRPEPRGDWWCLGGCLGGCFRWVISVAVAVVAAAVDAVDVGAVNVGAVDVGAVGVGP